MVVMSLPSARRRLGRIRCVQETIASLIEGKPLPASLCYVPLELEYYSPGKSILKLHASHCTSSQIVKELVCTAESRLIVKGEELCNKHGKWLQIKKFKQSSNTDFEDVDVEAWLLLFSNRSSVEETPPAVPVTKDMQISEHLKDTLCSWEDVVDDHFSLKIQQRCLRVAPADESAVKVLQAVSGAWSLEHDEALVQLMAQHIPRDNDALGAIKSFVELVDVSSYCDEDGPLNLTDGDPDTYWESDGSQGQHWIQLRMKKGTVIKKLCITLDGSDDNYLPSRLVVQGGEQENLKILNTVHINWTITGTQDVVLLENMTEHYPVIMIRIKECFGGIDTRIRGIKLVSTEERSLGFDRDFFTTKNLVRFPVLESFSPDALYRRAIALQRFVTTLDSVLQYMVPAWQHTVGSYTCLQKIRQLLLLSKRRLNLIEVFLKDTAADPAEKPVVYINRRAAMEHRCDPSLDPDCKSTVFVQLFEGLKPRDLTSRPLHYRWSSRYDQWWECKFLSEGIIDQGGGFRDSLSDIAEELCPTSAESSLPLSFFIRAPNQTHNDSNVNRDVYIPNPACQEFEKFEWIGKLMGACFRSKENLVLSLPSFFWKTMVGETTTWSRDFHTVNSAEVLLINSLASMDSDTFTVLGRNWSVLLSNGTQVALRINKDGNPENLDYNDRMQYAQEARNIIMNESQEQMEAIRRGLMSVVPQAVLELLTWQELESRVCGDPFISVEALRKTTYYDDLDEADIRVKYLWEALTAFSNEDRSRFLRFVTGRRRLPAPLVISSGKGDGMDSLPESSTCANMLYLPYYSSAKMAEEKLRYAIYNCIAIDNDMNPWED
ncbi:E3 ubiquitin-protein ligase HECTD3-like isoform X2 [Pomacea canaliculata]|uniref:E3 ubiquitin-protein ligase HECTD3-like isoform X2 n=1 Tax=Pomacea canaliculata TaxID=400727 RepID=UPI000D7362BC|nr:E3 ubiquitin-protein ligase HECTD3-like isoform X2 [Pomacea canaliculata]